MLLWVLTSNPTLSEAARSAIADGSNRILVSAVSAWEITIKTALGKLKAPSDLATQLRRHRFAALDVTIAHAFAVGALADHHADPFDRLLIAQARTDRLTLITRDPQIRRYDVTVLVA